MKHMRVLAWASFLFSESKKKEPREKAGGVVEGASSRRPAKLRAARPYLALPNLKPLLGASPLGASPAPPNLNPLLGASPADTESQCGWHYQYARALGGKVRQAHGTAPSPRCHRAGVGPARC